MASNDGRPPEDRGLTTRIGPIEIDWPQSIGYYGGIGLAVTAGLIEAPLGIFIAAVPVFKMLNFPGAPLPVRFTSQLFEGASKPVGGDGDAAIRVNNSSGGFLGGIWSDAKAVARGPAGGR